MLLTVWIFLLPVFSVFAGDMYGQPPQRLSDTIVIPFEHKQSAIIHQYTLDVLDSVVRIMKDDIRIVLSIEGYAYVDEGSDTICKYLSLNRALFVREAMLGRGIDSARIVTIKAMGEWKPEKRGRYKVNGVYPYRTEMLMIYPPPPKEVIVRDTDGDGLSDGMDSCMNEFGYKEINGCPIKNVIIVPFEQNQSYLNPPAYRVLDNLIGLIKQNPGYSISIGGHASKTEGIKSVTDKLSKERADIIFRYLTSRNFSASRIDSITSYGQSRPINAQRNSKEISENAGVEIIINKHDL